MAHPGGQERVANPKFVAVSELREVALRLIEKLRLRVKEGYEFGAADHGAAVQDPAESKQDIAEDVQRCGLVDEADQERDTPVGVLDSAEAFHRASAANPAADQLLLGAAIQARTAMAYASKSRRRDAAAVCSRPPSSGQAPRVLTAAASASGSRY